MYVSSVVLYLLTRASQKQGITVQSYSLWIFGLPTLIFAVMAFVQRIPLQTSASNWFWLIVSAVLFSWLGNYFSQKSMLLAANPGYPLIISKSYVIFTSIASIWLFRAPLSLKSLLGIILIIISSALITLSDRRHDITLRHDLSWFFHALGAFFCWGLLALSSKYLLNQGVSVIFRLLVVNLIVTVILLLETKTKNISLKTTSSHLPLLIGLGISQTLFNYFMQLGYNLAANPGYINATNAASIAAVTIFAALIFHDQLSAKKMLGIVGATGGLLLLLL